jgi:hypothetical protein
MSDQAIPPPVENKDAYLCYNKADRDWVKDLAEQLESETIDGSSNSRHLSVFLDLWDIDSGESLIHKMNEGMKNSRHVITVLSPEFMKAPWPTFEWTHIVCLDPMNAQRRLVPLLLRDVSKDGKERIDLCAPFRGLKYLDFRRKEDFVPIFRELVCRLRGQKQERGVLRPPLAGAAPLVRGDGAEESWRPDSVEEVLLSNLLPVESLPPMVWGAKTEAREKSQVVALVKQAPGFILKEGRLYTFENLESPTAVLRAAVNLQTIDKPIPTKVWLEHDDWRKWLMNLLNRCLAGHLSHLAIKKEKGGRYFFRPKDGQNRVWQNGNDKEREVAAIKPNLSGDGHFWVHHAARINFRRVGKSVFLQVEPTYLFTGDGEIPLEGQSTNRLSMMWSGRQKNPDILRNLVFWAKTMARSGESITIDTGGQPIVVSAVPATTKVNVGIEGDAVRIGSLMHQLDHELDDAAKDVVVAESEETEDEEVTEDIGEN